MHGLIGAILPGADRSCLSVLLGRYLAEFRSETLDKYPCGTSSGRHLSQVYSTRSWAYWNKIQE